MYVSIYTPKWIHFGSTDDTTDHGSGFHGMRWILRAKCAGLWVPIWVVSGGILHMCIQNGSILGVISAIIYPTPYPCTRARVQ